MGRGAERSHRAGGFLLFLVFFVVVGALVLGILVYTEVHDRGRTFVDLATEPAAGAHPEGARLVEDGHTDCAFRSPCRTTRRLYWASALAPAEALAQETAALQALGYAATDATWPGECRRVPGTHHLRKGGATARIEVYPAPHCFGSAGRPCVNGIRDASALLVQLDNFSTDDDAALRAEGKCQP